MKIERIATKVFLVLAAAMFVALSYYSLRYSQVNMELSHGERLTDIKDNLFLNVIFVGFSLIVVGTLSKYLEKFSEKILFIALIVVNLIMIGSSIYWLSGHTFEPIADQAALVTIAQDIINGDFASHMLEIDGYIRKCPHQIGIVSVYIVISKILGSVKYEYFQYFNILSVSMILCAGYSILKTIVPQQKSVRWSYMLLMLLCLPMYAYVPFIYGEIASIAFLMLGVALMLPCIDKFKWYMAVFSGLAIAISIYCRQNSLIALVAIILVLGIKSIFEKNKKTFLLLIIIVFCVVASQWFMEKLYEPYKYEGKCGIPVTAYIAMGLDDSAAGPGWYNGYHGRVFCYEALGDVDIAHDISVQHIKDRLHELSESNRLVSFFSQKIIKQWNAPMYQGLVMNSVNVSESKGLVYKVYIEDGMKFAEKFANIHQLFVFLGVLYYVIHSIALEGKKTIKLEHLTILITIFGGLLFSMIWEAKARYVFPYYILMLPYAAIGIQCLYGSVTGKIMTICKKK